MQPVVQRALKSPNPSCLCLARPNNASILHMCNVRGKLILYCKESAVLPCPCLACNAAAPYHPIPII